MIEAPAHCFAETAPCACYEDGGCECAREERALRNIIAGRYRALTAEEREWCAEQILAVEGYDQTFVDGKDDAALAGTVLAAWTDFCRDKGLL